MADHLRIEHMLIILDAAPDSDARCTVLTTFQGILLAESLAEIRPYRTRSRVAARRQTCQAGLEWCAAMFRLEAHWEVNADRADALLAAAALCMADAHAV
jgi:hypothetical protein